MALGPLNGHYGNRAVAISTMVAVVVVVASILGGALMSPGLPVVGKTISQLTNHGVPGEYVVRLGIVIHGALLIPMSLSVIQRSRARGPLTRTLSYGVLVYALGSVVTGSFANDSTDRIFGTVEVDTIHDSAAQLLYGAAAFSTLGVALSAAHVGQGLRVLSLVVSLALFVTGASLVLDLFPSLAGFQERLGLGGFQVWLAVLAFRLLTPTHASDTEQAVLGPETSADGAFTNHT